MEALNIEEIAKKATNVVKMSPKGSEADFEKRLKENKKKAKAKEANDIIEDYSNQQAELMEKFNIENNIPDLFYVVKSGIKKAIIKDGELSGFKDISGTPIFLDRVEED